MRSLMQADLPRAQVLFHHQWVANARRTDRMFAVLMVLQWIAAVIVSLVVSPKTWNGAESQVHLHVWFSLLLGGALTTLPVYMAWRCSGQPLTRHVIAIAQIMFSSLLIHVSGGRIETHFHVFGSLAFLAFYRDWRVLVLPTVLVAIDHYFRGVYWPETVFGIATASPWRWLEHAAWVLYEDVFLVMACRNGVRDMWTSAARTAELERTNGAMRAKTEELEDAYRLRNAMVATALDAMIGMDSQGRIIEWNSQAEAAFGWSAEEAIGRVLADTIIPAAFREAHAAGLRTYLETGASRVLNQRIEVTALHRDGHEFPVEVAIAPLHEGPTVRFCAFLRDITARNHAAEALRNAKEAAEAASRAKSDFLANMSHEIRTPLNGILGFAAVLRDDPDVAPAARRDYLKTIHDSGRHLLTLIDDVLDLSKIESEQMEIECIRCSPYEIIAETISILRVRAQERGLSLEYIWKTEIPESIESDPARLRQILMNLVGNAIKFTEVGSVQVTARLETGKSSRLVIDVIDTGVGMGQESLERIFAPFVQADSSITRRFGGTGLGLSISRRLARLLGGELSATSELGRGSVFTLILPTGPLDTVPLLKPGVADLMAARPAPPHGSGRTLPPCRILLVEDGVTNRKLISLVLKRAGAEVESAENGQLGVEAAENGCFDLVLMDMQMPVMDGYSATRELRDRGHTMPVVALTAHALKDDMQKCLDAGCSGYLTKPVDPNTLVDTMIQVLGDASPRPPRQDGNDESAGPLVSSLPADDREFREIVEEFVDRLEEKLAGLRDAWSGHDRAAVAGAAHWIKGAGGTAGFAAFTHPAAMLERLAKRDGNEDRIEHCIVELERLFSRIQLPLDA